MLHIIFLVQVDWMFVTIILPGMNAGGVTTEQTPGRSLGNSVYSNLVENREEVRS